MFKFELSLCYQNKENTVNVILVLSKASLQADPSNILDLVASCGLQQQMNSETHNPVCLLVTNF